MENAKTLFSSSKFAQVCESISSTITDTLGTRPPDVSPALAQSLHR